MHTAYMVSLPLPENVVGSLGCYVCLYQIALTVVLISLFHTGTETLLYIHKQRWSGPGTNMYTININTV